MINILLLCTFGASTSMIEAKMIEIAKKKNIDISVKAFPDSMITEKIEDSDLILLGPQIGYKLERFQKEFPQKAKVMMVIDPIDYGMLNAEAIMKKGLALINK